MPGHRKRRQFKQTDAFTRGMVIGLKRAGWSIRQIAADTHLGASTVHRLWRRWLEQGNVAIYRNVGATRVTSACVDRRILRQAVAAPQATCTAILQHVQDTLDHSISTRTISRRLVANGLHSCRPLRRLPLTPPNRRQRLEWCRARSTWMTEWHRVVFSDESRFCLSSDSRRVRVWRRRGERSNPAAIVERPTVRQRGIMVWGAIAYDSRSHLLRIQGTMTAQRYVDDVLRPVTLPYLQGVPNALYQQDNARPHTARISQQALQDVQMLPWPPYSPDLSPIEHVWDIIGRRLHALPQPRSEDELWQMVEREWRAIHQDAIRTMIDSLPRRVAACIAVREATKKMNAMRLSKKLWPQLKSRGRQISRQRTAISVVATNMSTLSFMAECLLQDCLYCKYTTCLHADRAARFCRAPPFSHPGGCMATGDTPNLVRAESPLKADQMPGRHGLKAHLCAEKSTIFNSQSNFSNNQEAFDKYANLPAGGKDVNLAAPFNLAANPSSNAVAQAHRNWADMTEDINPEIEDNFTLVQRRKRRRGSANSPTANAPSSNVGGSRTDRRPRSSTGWAPRAEEVRTTRAHIAETRAQQASSSEEYCVYIERSPDLEPFHYLRALDRMVGGTGGVVQVSKVNGLYLLGLTNRGLVERLISEGLEVEGTLLKAFPFRKRAERITVGNLPFFVADSVIINALSTFGRVTSIAPKLMKAGPHIYNDGRREAFIALHEGVTIERLPTRLEIKIKGETWPAYLTSGIRCSRCHGQGHCKAICPLLAGLANSTRMAPPTTPAGVTPPTTPAPPQRSAAQPPAPASSDPALETPGAPLAARAVTTSTAPRPSPPVAPAVPMEEAPSAPPPVTPAPSLQVPEEDPRACGPNTGRGDVHRGGDLCVLHLISKERNEKRFDAFIERHPSVSFAGTDALGLGREEVLDLLSSRTKAQRNGPLLSPPQGDALAGLIKQNLDLRPGAGSNIYKVLGQVKAELRTTPDAVPTPPLPAPRPSELAPLTSHGKQLSPAFRTPPLPAPTEMEEDVPRTEEERCAPPPPAPRLAGPIPPVPHGDTTTLAMVTSPPPLSTQMDRALIDKRWEALRDLIHELDRELELDLEHRFQSQVDVDDIIRAILYPGDREPLIKRLPTRDRCTLGGFMSTAIRRAREFDPFVLERSAGQKPGRPSIPPPTGSENSAKNQFYREIYKENSNTEEYANPPDDSGNVNLAAARVDVTSGSAATLSSNSAALAIRNWADHDEDMNPGTDNDFTVVKTKKRRRESSNSPTAAAPSSNSGGARSSRRLHSSARSVPRAQEIPTTRTHITEARARQASSSEEHCVYLEHGPELHPFHYLRALDRLLGGTAGIIQISKVNGHQLLGLANRGLAERLINNGLEVEGTLLRAFPFRKRAERITVGNLPFFVEDSAIIKALGPYGRITFIAPKMMKAGPYTYTDGRREAFIVLHEGVTTERLPTRLNITIKGEAWPAYLSSGIKCSRCHGQGHRRANCPLLAGRTTAPGPATPTSPTSVAPATAPRLPQQPSAQPPPPAFPSPTMEVSDVPPTSRAALHPPEALRQSSPAPSALPAEDAPPASPSVTPAPSLRTPGSRESAAPTPDVEMSIVEETSASSTSTAKNATRIDLDAFIERHPSVSFAETDALGLGREEVLDLLSLRTKTQRSVPLLPPSQCDAIAGLIRQILDLRPGAASNLYKVLGQVKAELRTTPAAVPTPPPPAPRPAEPAPPAPHGEKTSPAIATPPPPMSTQMIDACYDEANDLIYKLCHERYSGPISDMGASEGVIVEAIIFPDDREPLLRRLSTRKKNILAEIVSAAIERARDSDPFVREGLHALRKMLPPLIESRRPSVKAPPGVNFKL
ncbi:hypothetical protein LAZ67_8002483 [Cordylochernes scorpioides]|uniref:CCHC-type domain-containing protein n=1 Tax=Cordylochernes scorpioides TaxID=51811 RepID=A0ABY6KW04_9ARAC|nr:hypothetical protein LAZ67_8002483 [Cordylochernes scorpioides]